MAQKRDVLALLSRDELTGIVDRFELVVRDRRKRDDLIEAVAASRKATLAEVLPGLPRDRLKELCRTLDLDDSGREKTVLVDRLGGGREGASPASPGTVGRVQTTLFKDDQPTPPKPSKSDAPPPRQRPGGNGSQGQKKNGGDLGFEATLWQAADKLRNNLDAAEYKHVVLGLIFLKYISDAFLDRYKQLELEIEDGADPEDPDEYRAKNVFWVPQEARWEKVQANAKRPNIGQVIDDAMTAIERENPSLRGVLAKNYVRLSTTYRQETPDRVYKLEGVS
jgi:type I restriction enzyme M protein